MSQNSPQYPNRLRQVIKHCGLTVKEVAEETNIPLRTLFAYCSGSVPIERGRLEALANFLGYPMDYLVPPLIVEDGNVNLSSSNQESNIEQHADQEFHANEQPGTIPDKVKITHDSNISTSISTHRQQEIVPFPSCFITTGVHPDTQQQGVWLTHGAGYLAQLLDQGWSFDNTLVSLQLLLPIIKAMPIIVRGTFPPADLTVPLNMFPFSIGKQVSEEESIQIYQALGESITAGWKLFVLGKNVQALAVSQAQLMLLQYVSAILSVHQRSVLYSSIYNFLGVALSTQGYYHEALNAHSNAYIAALGAGDTLGVAYSLLGQANCYFVLAQHSLAIGIVQQALRTLDALDDQQPTHVKAHLLGVWADSAMIAGDYKTARQQLDAILVLLNDLSPNEEFDRANWYQLSGKYAYLTGDYAAAVCWCERALQELPETSIIRRTLALMPLLAANTFMGDLDASMITLEKAKQIIPYLQAPIMNQPLRQGLQGFLVVFPHESKVKSIVSELMQHLC